MNLQRRIEQACENLAVTTRRINFWRGELPGYHRKQVNFPDEYAAELVKALAHEGLEIRLIESEVR